MISFIVEAQSTIEEMEMSGHPHLTKLKMVPKFSLQTLECQSCQVGKHIKSSFPKHSESGCDYFFFIIHCDIWGPTRASSFGFRYFRYNLYSPA